MAKLIDGNEFNRRRQEAESRYLVLDEKLKPLQQLLGEGLFNTAHRRIIVTDHPLEGERQKWATLLDLSSSKELIDEALQHTLTNQDYKKLISLMEQCGLWP